MRQRRKGGVDIRTPRRYPVVAAVVFGLLLSAPAAAYLCHKDPPGTRVLFLHGRIGHYSAVGTTVTFALRNAKGCRTFVWHAPSGTVQEQTGNCAAANPPRLLAVQRSRVAVDDGAGPPVLEVSRGGVVTHRWPLPARPATLALSDEFAVFSARGGGGLYALRLSDGSAGLLGPNRPHDAPSLTRAGIFYQDDEFKQDRRKGIVRLKFVPASGIATIIDRAQAPLLTSGRIESLAMDGPRVALAAADPSGVCDRVLYWNVAWRPVQRISASDGPTCVLKRHTAISRVAIGGFRAAWLRAAGSEQAIVAGSPKCQEWVIRRLTAGPGGDSVTSVAGDGKTLAFAIARHEREMRGTAEIAVISGRFRPIDVASRRGSPEQLAVDGTRVAVLWDDGTAEVRGIRGRLLQTLQVGRADSLALSGHELVVLRRARLEAYSLLTETRMGKWTVRPDVHGLDVDYGVAVMHSDHVVYAVDLKTGRSVVLAETTGSIVDAQIEATGVAYAYNAGGRGIARFIPIAAVERALPRG